jgi:uncharacterized caspase-like protein
MKKILILLTLTSLFFITSCELFMEEPKQGDVYYINVGIDYKNNGTTLDDKEDDLKGTVNDARELHEAIKSIALKTGRTDHGFLMVQDEKIIHPTASLYPSEAKISTKLAALKNNNVKENDLTIFTYSGHGVKETGTLVFATATEDQAPIPSDYMDVSDLLSLMAQIPGKKLVILDSCFSGMAVEESPSSTNTVLNNSISKFFETYYSSNQYEKPDLYVLTASAHADSYEMKFGTDANAHYHGVFTYALLEALGWDHPHNTDISTVSPQAPPAAKGGRITVDGLFRYVKKNQALNTRLKLFSKWSEFQHPLTTGGPLDLVLFNL